MFAVVTIAGKQYTVSEGQKITVDRLEGAVGDSLSFDRVLLVEKDGKTKVGTPKVAGATVKAKIVSQGKGEKLNVRRYKSKVRYRRSIGFRAHETELEITSVG